MTRLNSRLLAAKERLDRLDLYPEPVRLEGVRVLVTPWVFRLFFRRYHGLALTSRTILMREPDYGENLLTHELCHIWQSQHRRWDAFKRYWTTSYEENPYELEARHADHSTRPGVVRLSDAERDRLVDLFPPDTETAWVESSA